MNDAIGYIILGLVFVIIIILLVNSASSGSGSGSSHGGGGSGRRPYGPYYEHGGQGYQPGVLY